MLSSHKPVKSFSQTHVEGSEISEGPLAEVCVLQDLGINGVDLSRVGWRIGRRVIAKLSGRTVNSGFCCLFKDP